MNFLCLRFKLGEITFGNLLATFRKAETNQLVSVTDSSSRTITTVIPGATPNYINNLLGALP